MQTDVDCGPFFELSPEPCFLLGPDATIVAANRATEKLGYSSAEVVGRPFSQIVHPQSKEALAAWIESSPPEPLNVEMRGSGGAWWGYELRVTTSAGGHRAVFARENTMDEGGKRTLLAHANWQALSACLTDFVVTTDDRASIMTLNRDPPGIPPEELIGKPDGMFTFIAPEERPALRRRFAHVMATGETVSYETQVAYPDNSIGTFQSRLGPIRVDGRVVGTVLVTRDMTAQRQAEAARSVAEKSLREYMIQLERSNDELERFASVASHDLQEPLRKIQAFSERLDRKFTAQLPATARDYISRMQDAARRMQDLINDLLMFSRLANEGSSVAGLDLDRLVGTVVSDLEVRIEENKGRVELGELPKIDGDPLRIRQLFQNLVANAIKFRRPGVAPVVKISAEEVEVEGVKVARFSIADNGIGIEPRYRERIFGIFERLHGRGIYEGTGIGLAICRKICEQHGGSISVGSPEGEGTLFIVELPIKAMKEE